MLAFVVTMWWELLVLNDFVDGSTMCAWHPIADSSAAELFKPQWLRVGVTQVSILITNQTKF